MANKDAPRRVRSRIPRKARQDERKQFMVFLRPDLIKRIKFMTIERGCFTYRLVEDILYDAMEIIEEECQRQDNPHPWKK